MGLKSHLFNIYWKLEARIAPGNRYSQTVYEEVLRDTLRPGWRWLELGCGHRVLPEWREAAERDLVSQASLVVGTDYDLSSIERHRSIGLLCRSDAMALPFGPESFDLVTANMVVEHLVEPERVFAEVRRVLAPGGTFLFHTPNARGYPVRLAGALPQWAKNLLARVLEGRASDDVFPTYYRANTPESIDAIARRAGLVVDGVRLETTSAALILLTPLVVLELLWIRFLRGARGERWRTNVIARLRRP